MKEGQNYYRITDLASEGRASAERLGRKLRMPSRWRSCCVLRRENAVQVGQRSWRAAAG
jgi:hypothetical protein